jgi:O-antigen ligase
VQPLYIGISIAALIIVVVLLLISREKGKQLRKPSNLATLGMTLVVLGIIFGDNRWTGYSLIGFGVLFSVIDMIRNLKKPK